MTTARFIIAVVSTLVEEFALYAIWRWALPELDIYVPKWLLVVVMIAWAVFAVVSFIFVTRVLRQRATVGLPTMVGTKGKAISPLKPEGQVMIKGERWGAKSIDSYIDIGEAVTVVGQDGLHLIVRRTGAGNNATR